MWMRLSPQPWPWKHAMAMGQQNKSWKSGNLKIYWVQITAKCICQSNVYYTPWQNSRSFLPALSRLREINQFLQAPFFWKATSITDRKGGGNYGVTPEDYFHFLYKKFVLSSDIKWPHLSFKLNLKLQNLNSVS